MDNKSGKAAVLDLGKWPTAQKFVARCWTQRNGRFRTPGEDLEALLNRDFGPGSAVYDDVRRYVEQGLREGWVAPTEIAGPSAPTGCFSITAVYMDSGGGTARGEFHGHPYGEINCAVPPDAGAELRGMQGWRGAGWTAPGPGTRHCPEVRGGQLVALFSLPAGRIWYGGPEARVK